MRYLEVSEATLPVTLHSQRYYHGTQSKKAAENILRIGIRPGMKTGYKGDLRPAKDRVYLTTDLNLALVHALGARYNTQMSNTFNEDRTHGYVFIVDGKDLMTVDPDEDAVGEFLWNYTTGHPHLGKPVFDDRHDIEPEVRRQIWDFIIGHGRQSDVRDSLILGPKRPGAWAALGKTIQPIMPDWMKSKLIEWGASIAHIGMIQPNECWRIARTDLSKLDGLDNFFEIAERIR